MNARMTACLREIGAPDSCINFFNTGEDKEKCIEFYTTRAWNAGEQRCYLDGLLV